MDITISQLMDLFLDSPLVTWVSAFYLYWWGMEGWGLLNLCKVHDLKCLWDYKCQHVLSGVGGIASKFHSS